MVREQPTRSGIHSDSRGAHSTGFRVQLVQYVALAWHCASYTPHPSPHFPYCQLHPLPLTDIPTQNKHCSLQCWLLGSPDNLGMLKHTEPAWHSQMVCCCKPHSTTTRHPSRECTPQTWQIYINDCHTSWQDHNFHHDHTSYHDHSTCLAKHPFWQGIQPSSLWVNPSTSVQEVNLTSCCGAFHHSAPHRWPISCWWNEASP